MSKIFFMVVILMGNVAYGAIRSTQVERQDEARFAVRLLANGEPVCSGFQIEKDIVLTADHCLSSIKVNQIEVYNIDQGEVETVAIASQISANYLGSTADIALLKLSSTVNSAYENQMPQLAEGHLCNGNLVSFGFGIDEGHSMTKSSIVAVISQTSTPLLVAPLAVVFYLMGKPGWACALNTSIRAADVSQNNRLLRLLIQHLKGGVTPSSSRGGAFSG